ncbi:MAG: serine/threonine protein kinase, partial [Myxococcales bacterium]|nr:serine/threonine protein kinase [Myxococcales bacterium]
MSRRDTEEPPTHRVPPKRTPEAETLAISRFGKTTEPRALVGEVLAQDAMNDTTVDRYRMLELLGRGGMGEVTKSLDLKIGREIALKTMRPIAPEDLPQATSRFLREARVQALLEHPSIVPVYDIAFGPDGPYFTMKRVRGETLLDIIEGSRNTVKSTLGLRHSRHRLLSAFVTVCLAVDYAHQSGVVHRDLKPDNIMLGNHGEVYVLDWGVARVLPVGDRQSVVGDDSDDTHPGDMVGTPGFMSPEQVLGQLELVDAKSDVFALGAILYELLTHEPLIEDGTNIAVLEATLNPDRPPPPPRDVPPELYTLIL